MDLRTLNLKVAKIHEESARNRDFSAVLANSLLEGVSKGKREKTVDQLRPRDHMLLLGREYCPDGLNEQDLERLAILDRSGFKVDDAYIPDSKEMALFHKLNGRGVAKDKLVRIALDDCGLDAVATEKLLANGMLKEKDGRVFPSWRDPKAIWEARVWLATSETCKDATEAAALLASARIKQPRQELLDKLRGKVQPRAVPKQTVDYHLYFKIQRREELTPFETRRLNELRENGEHPESKVFANWLKVDPSGWRMKGARKRAFLNHYETKYGVNIEALQFLNTFKQMTREQLIKIGLQPEELARYANGVNGQHRLLHRHNLPTREGPVEFYSLTHTGVISGRAFLEQHIAKKDVARQPQGRWDLTPHDLKVVDGVLHVIAEKKKQGMRLKEIIHETKQSSREKTGVQNDQRQRGREFMDALLIFEEEETTGQSKGRSERIAVEYGNYPVEVMRSKIENTEFDQAFIFSSPEYTAKYTRAMTYPTVSFLSI